MSCILWLARLENITFQIKTSSLYLKILTHQFEHLDWIHLGQNLGTAWILFSSYPKDVYQIVLFFILGAGVNLILGQGQLKIIGLSTFLYLYAGYSTYLYPDVLIQPLFSSETHLKNIVHTMLLCDLLGIGLKYFRGLKTRTGHEYHLAGFLAGRILAY